jgi:hypothetical protein
VSLISVRDSLVAALGTVDGLRIYTDPGALVDPPSVIIGLPDLDYQVFSDPTPTDATLQLYLMVAADDRATDNLSALIDSVTDAVWTAAEFAVTRAIPGVYLTSNVELPAYVLTVSGPAN